jgi:hypothetical protein
VSRNPRHHPVEPDHEEGEAEDEHEREHAEGGVGEHDEREDDGKEADRRRHRAVPSGQPYRCLLHEFTFRPRQSREYILLCVGKAGGCTAVSVVPKNPPGIAAVELFWDPGLRTGANPRCRSVNHQTGPMFANRTIGWVFVADSKERLREWVRPGSTRLWDDARSVGKEPGQPVLFLQLLRSGARWEGSGSIVDVEERWKAFGVRVRCNRLLPAGLPAVLRAASDTAGAVIDGSAGVARPDEWENRNLAALLGLIEFGSRTPFLNEGRDVRLTDADLRSVLALQPAIRQLLPE